MTPLVVLAFCTTLFGFSLTGFLPVFVQTIFHKGPETYTLLLVFSGAGSICGALIVAAMEKFKGQQRLTVLILTFLGFAIAAFALSTWLPLSCLLIFFTGVAVMASASLMLSLVQLITTDAMRGRVMSVYNLAFRAGIPLGSLALGKLIPIFGVGTASEPASCWSPCVSLFPVCQGRGELPMTYSIFQKKIRTLEKRSAVTFPLRSGALIQNQRADCTS